MRTAIYPGSFNPWHKGHRDVLDKALKCFDKVIVALAINPDKREPLNEIEKRVKVISHSFPYDDKVEVLSFGGLLVDFVKTRPIDAVVRGLRNGADLQYEQNLQYWNEDLGLLIPTIYFICDRNVSHISSSMVRALETFR